MKETIRNFILENYMFGAAPEELDDDASFLATGIIDSTGVMQLIQFIEEEFAIKVEDTELTPDNLDSVNRVCNLLERKGAGASA